MDGVMIIIGKEDISVLVVKNCVMSKLVFLFVVDNLFGEDYLDYYCLLWIIYCVLEEKISMVKLLSKFLKLIDGLIKIILLFFIMVVIMVMIFIF